MRSSDQRTELVWKSWQSLRQDPAEVDERTLRWKRFFCLPLLEQKAARLRARLGTARRAAAD